MERKDGTKNTWAIGGISFWEDTGEIVLFPQNFSQASLTIMPSLIVFLSEMITRASVFTWASQKGKDYQMRGPGVGTSNSLINQLECSPGEYGAYKAMNVHFWVWSRQVEWLLLMDIGKGIYSYTDWAFD